MNDTTRNEETCEACGSSDVRYRYGIGGGWAFACQPCRDAAIALPYDADDDEHMDASDFQIIESE